MGYSGDLSFIFTESLSMAASAIRYTGMCFPDFDLSLFHFALKPLKEAHICLLSKASSMMFVENRVPCAYLIAH